MRVLLCLPLPTIRVLRVLGVGDFALRRRHRYATILIDAETRRRVDVLPGRGTDAREAWPRERPGALIVSRDGSGAYAKAARCPMRCRSVTGWHILHNLGEAVLKQVAAHSACLAKAGPPNREGKRAATTRERRQQAHDLLDKDVGLLECSNAHAGWTSP